jgi:hypothetical protein
MLGHNDRLTPAKCLRAYLKIQKNEFRDGGCHRGGAVPKFLPTIAGGPRRYGTIYSRDKLRPGFWPAVRHYGTVVALIVSASNIPIRVIVIFRDCRL